MDKIRTIEFKNGVGRLTRVALFHLFSLAHYMSNGKETGDTVKLISAGVNGNNSVNLLSRLNRDVFRTRHMILSMDVGLFQHVSTNLIIFYTIMTRAFQAP